MKLCRYCRLNSSSSREHVIANSRLRDLRNFQTNIGENLQKQFKGITCESCNNKLGNQYESLSPINQAYATIWKILAGNVNNVFSKAPDFQISKTPRDELHFFEDRFLEVLRENKILLENTFHFDWDAERDFIDHYGVATKKVLHKATDYLGNPLGAVKVSFKDRAGSHKEKAYTIETGPDGAGQMEMGMHVELARVVTEDLRIKNLENNVTHTIPADIIIYISQAINAHRIAVIIILPCITISEWPFSKFDFYHSDFLSILKIHFPEFKFKALNPFFETPTQVDGE